MEKNSQQQVNENYSDYRDRMDVNKAWEDYNPFGNDYLTVKRAKDFAVYFAKRVKGGKP